MELVRDCTVLKLAHHGSRNGTDARWLGIVRPKLAIASLGANNGYGHPSAQTLALLDRRGIPLLRTDQDGTIELVSDGERWEVVKPRHASRGPPALAGGTEGTAKRAVAGRKSQGPGIDINTASQADLESLPGIGPTIARRIIEGRPFDSVDDLLRVKGIGAKRLAEIRLQIKAR